jgi:hypothetical protein
LNEREEEKVRRKLSVSRPNFVYIFNFAFSSRRRLKTNKYREKKKVREEKRNEINLCIST